MCAPQKIEKTMPPPAATKAPPPPEKTADNLYSRKDEEELTAGLKKKRGVSALKLSDVSALTIPDMQSKTGLYIP